MHTHARARTCAHSHTITHVCTLTHRHTRVHTHTYIIIHTRAHAYSHVHTHTCAPHPHTRFLSAHNELCRAVGRTRQTPACAGATATGQRREPSRAGAASAPAPHLPAAAEHPAQTAAQDSSINPAQRALNNEIPAISRDNHLLTRNAAARRARRTPHDRRSLARALQSLFMKQSRGPI